MDDIDALLDLEDALGEDDPWDGEEENEAPPPPAKRPAAAAAASASDPKRARAEPAGGPGGEAAAPAPAPMENGGAPAAATAEDGGTEEEDGGSGDDDDGDDPLLPPPPPRLPRRAAGDIDGDALPVTSASGDRVYCEVGPPRTRGGCVAGAVDGGSGCAGGVPTVAGLLLMGGPAGDAGRRGRRRRRRCLLSAPLEELQEEADRVALEAAVAVADAADAAEARAAAAAEAEAEAGAGAPPPAAPSAGGVSAARRAGPAALWADRHAPLAYTDLLSDEATNRAVLRWLGGWRETVFGGGGEGGGRGGPAQPRLRGAPPTTAPTGGGGGGRRDTRPPQKILLLTGPPGLGKTTLAHIAAAHAGYRAVEVNASDERSAAALGGRVRDAVEMGCVADRGAPGPGGGVGGPPSTSTRPRPVCVIVDEVDGAAGGPEGRSAVAALLKIVQAAGGGKKGGGGGGGGRTGGGGAAGAREDGGSESDGEDEGGGSPSSARRPTARRAKKGGGAAGAAAAGTPASSSLPRLARPIIAIANDAFAPALRPLRSVALVLNVRAPPPDRLVARLQAICAAEGVKAERRALARVVGAAGGDARAALHALQLLARKAGPGGTITDAAAATARAGVKDARASAFEVWGALLQARPKGSSGGPAALRPPHPGGGGGGRGGAHSDASAAWDAVADFGDADLVLRGLHDALPHARLAEGRARRAADAAEALSEGDALLGRAARGGGGGGGGGSAFSLLRFAPASALAFRAAVAGPDRPRFAGWPMTAADAARATDANAATLRAWLAGLAPCVRSGVTPARAALDLLPALVAVAARPALRPVAPHLLTPGERSALAASVSALAAYGLTYAPRPPGAGSEPPAAVFAARRAAAAAALEDGAAWRGGGGGGGGFQPGAPRSTSSDADGGLALAPPVDDLVAFPVRASSVKAPRGGVGGGGGAPPAPAAAAPPPGPPQPVRALLAQEVEREHIRRRQAAAAVKAAAAGAGEGGAATTPAPRPGGAARRASLPLTVAERAKEAAAKAAAAAGGGGGGGGGGGAKAASAAKSAAPPATRAAHWLDALQARAAGGGAKAAAARAAASAAAAAALAATPGKGAAAAVACTPGGRPVPRASFKFHEGYTNAVRRPVRGRDLL